MYVIISHWILLRIRHFSGRSCRENPKHILRSTIFFPENLSIYDVRWKNIVQPDRSQITIWRMRCAWWIIKATNTHSQYVTLTAFPLQQSFHEWPQWYVIRTYIACLVTMHSPRQPLHTALNVTYLQICLLIFQNNSWRKFEQKEAIQDMYI